MNSYSGTFEAGGCPIPWTCKLWIRSLAADSSERMWHHCLCVSCLDLAWLVLWKFRAAGLDGLLSGSLNSSPSVWTIFILNIFFRGSSESVFFFDQVAEVSLLILFCLVPLLCPMATWLERIDWNQVIHCSPCYGNSMLIEVDFGSSCIWNWVFDFQIDSLMSMVSSPELGKHSVSSLLLGDQRAWSNEAEVHDHYSNSISLKN